MMDKNWVRDFQKTTSKYFEIILFERWNSSRGKSKINFWSIFLDNHEIKTVMYIQWIVNMALNLLKISDGKINN